MFKTPTVFIQLPVKLGEERYETFVLTWLRIQDDTSSIIAYLYVQ